MMSFKAAFDPKAERIRCRIPAVLHFWPREQASILLQVERKG